MDSAIGTGVNGVLSTLVTYLFGSTVDLKNASGTAVQWQLGLYLGYGGAALAFFLSVAGAYTAGSNIISELDVSYFSFLEDF